MMKHTIDKNGERKTYREDKLRKKLRKNEFTGLELIKQDGQT